MTDKFKKRDIACGDISAPQCNNCVFSNRSEGEYRCLLSDIIVRCGKPIRDNYYSIKIPTLSGFDKCDQRIEGDLRDISRKSRNTSPL